MVTPSEDAPDYTRSSGHLANSESLMRLKLKPLMMNLAGSRCNSVSAFSNCRNFVGLHFERPTSESEQDLAYKVTSSADERCWPGARGWQMISHPLALLHLSLFCKLDSLHLSRENPPFEMFWKLRQALAYLLRFACFPPRSKQLMIDVRSDTSWTAATAPTTSVVEAGIG